MISHPGKEPRHRTVHRCYETWHIYNLFDGRCQNKECRYTHLLYIPSAVWYSLSAWAA